MESNKLDTPPISEENWAALNYLQCQILAWQAKNFPECQEWELALGVCEESGELAQCVLKLYRGMRSDEFDESRLKDAVGDIIIYLIGICGARGWFLSNVLQSTTERVLAREWRQTNCQNE